MPPSQQYRLEALLRGESFAWTRAGDLVEPEVLSRALEIWLDASDEEIEREDCGAWRRAVWMLDRLRPLDECELFRNLLEQYECPVSYLAWARRLRGRARERLFDTTPSDTAAFWMNVRGGGSLAGWAVTRTDEETESMLVDWISPVQARALKPTCVPALLSEHRRRVPDRHRRIEALKQALRQLPNTGPHAGWPWAFELYTRKLLEEIGPDLPPPDGEFPNNHPARWKELVDVLRYGGHSDVADLIETTWSGRYQPGFLPGCLWVARHTSGEWESLAEARPPMFEPDWISTRFARLAEIMPKDRPDAFREAIRRQERHGGDAIGAFCRWLPAEHRDFLRDDFDHASSDWAACAFTTYLHLAPEPYVQFLQRGGGHAGRGLTVVQEWILDRFLNAPEILKSPRVLQGARAVEQDPLLCDALNHRWG